MKKGFHFAGAIYSNIQSDNGSAIFSDIYSDEQVIKSLYSTGIGKIEWASFREEPRLF